MDPLIRSWADTPAQPWRNGGGITRELLRWPRGEDWQVRLSIAEIATSGPFSAYAGVMRWFAVLSGPGVELQWPSERVLLRPGDEPLRFDGARAPDCRLLGGPTLDLNLMLRGVDGGLWPALPGVPWRPGHAGCGLYTRDALELQVEAAAPVQLPTMSLCWWHAAPAGLCIGDFATGNAAGPATWWIGAGPRGGETGQ